MNFVKFNYFKVIILRIGRAIKRHWFVIICALISLILALIIAITILNWKHNVELIRLKDLIKSNKQKMKNMIKITNKLNRTDTWRTPDIQFAQILSAYLDSRPEVVLEEIPNAGSENTWALVRIIAILDVNLESVPLTCYYKFSPLKISNDQSTIMESPAVAVRIIAKTENFGMRYSAAFVICKLITTDDGRLPTDITFSSKSGKNVKHMNGINFVSIHYTDPEITYNNNNLISVCVPTLHHNYDKDANLIEFIEFYRMMGVNHFTFYNTSVSKNVSRILSHYQDMNIITVIEWKLPRYYVFERTLRYNGIFAALNDCLYRNAMLKGFKYTINVDLDEFIVPRKDQNFRQMMNYIDPISENKKFSTFMLRNMFFYLMLDDNPIPQPLLGIPKLLLHTKTLRWKRINPAYDRSKYIVRGQDIIEMGNHRVWLSRKISYLSRYKNKVIDPEIAGMHHYRLCEVNELVCWLRNFVQDATAHRFTFELTSRVAQIYKHIYSNKA